MLKIAILILMRVDNWYGLEMNFPLSTGTRKHRQVTKFG